MTALLVLMFGLLAGAFMCLWRVARGPTLADRVVAVDVLGILMLGFCAVLTVMTGKDLTMIVALSWSLLAFIGVLALAKHLERQGGHDRLQ
jgi:multicomponent Na+:H+ antiporter subunit F